ncbi:MAG: YajQ family cyclic di-GMP-binding protein [Bdellovibrionota bacterium]|nr:MAG: YajQ family cyclic di-GMP-binding protein [Bdellovibrionota bacterium]
MPSFDIVSKADAQEVKNAVDQVNREIGTRYDFRGTKTSIDISVAATGSKIMLLTDDKMRLEALQEILRQKLAKRGVSLKLVKFHDPVPAGGDMLRQEVDIKNGLEDDELKRVTKEIKNTKLKVTAQIQGDEVRVSGKKRDDLQSAIQHLRQQLPQMELQFVNFRE